jgi:calcineurin-like phosphoesterase family protein
MKTRPTIFFTADEHYGHTNIIRYCTRPFASAGVMDTEIIGRHNEFVGSQDEVIHAGDFTLVKRSIAEKYIKRLNGTHIFLKGNHNCWLKKSIAMIWERDIQGF